MEEIDEKDFEELKQQINEKKQGTIEGNLKKLKYEINLNKPLRVVLKDDTNEVEYFAGKLALSKIEVDSEEKRIHYRKKNKLNVGVMLTRKIYFVKSDINNKNYIMEKYIIREQFDDNMIPKNCEKIIDDVVESNSKAVKSQEGEFYIEPIESNDDFISLTHSEEDLMKYLVEGSKTKLGNFPAGFYEDRHDNEFNRKNRNNKQGKVNDFEEYYKLASEKLDKYKDIYSKIEKMVNGDSKEESVEQGSIEEKNQEEEFFDDNIDQIVENLKQKHKEEKIEEQEIHDEDIDDIVNELEKKRKQEKMEKIRNDKITEIRDLIKLNKELDEEIEIIEKGENKVE